MTINENDSVRFPSISFILTQFIKIMDISVDDLQRLSDRIQKDKDFEEIYKSINKFVNFDDLHQKKLRRFSKETDISFDQIKKLNYSFLIVLSFLFLKDKTYIHDIFLEIENLFSYYRTISNSSQIADTSEEKLIYIILAYIFIPFISIRMTEYKFGENNIDTGMPGGKFWFLPNIYGKRNEYPIQQVLDWIYKLSGKKSIKDFIETTISFGEDNKESNIKNYNNWIKGKPINYKKLLEIIDRIKPEDLQNCIDLDKEYGFEKKSQIALDYIEKNNFSAYDLSLEIPISEEVIKLFVSKSNSISKEVKEVIISEIHTRFKRPTKEMIENSFLIASFFQNGYNELIKNIGEKDSYSLVNLFIAIYNSYMQFLVMSEKEEIKFSSIYDSRKKYLEKIQEHVHLFQDADENYLEPFNKFRKSS